MWLFLEGKRNASSLCAKIKLDWEIFFPDAKLFYSHFTPFFSHSECKHCQIFVISNGQERRPYGWNFAVSDLCHLTKLAIPEEIGLEL